MFNAFTWQVFDNSKYAKFFVLLFRFRCTLQAVHGSYNKNSKTESFRNFYLLMKKLLLVPKVEQFTLLTMQNYAQSKKHNFNTEHIINHVLSKKQTNSQFGHLLLQIKHSSCFLTMHIMNHICFNSARCI